MKLRKFLGFYSTYEELKPIFAITYNIIIALFLQYL